VNKRATNTETQLQQVEAKLAGIIASAMDAIISVNTEHQILVFNEAAERIFGYSREEALQMSVHDLLPESFRAAHVHHIQSFAKTGVTTRSMGALRPLAARRKDGSEFPIEAAISQVEVDGQKIFTVILRDVSERKSAEAERERLLQAEREAREAAEAANTAKSEFLAMMSHELRTPLNAIAGYIQLMEMGLHGPVTERQKDALQRVQRSQSHLLRLINEVLNFARLETTQLQYSLTAIPVTELLQALEAIVHPLISQKRLRYTQVVGDPAAVVHADVERVQQILLNLISNAAKFTPPGGHISVIVERHETHVDVLVADTGRGIAEADQAKIFEPFVQIDRALTREDGGVGLGLAISRDLARAMGGDLTVESMPERGATFRLSLPVPTIVGDVSPQPLPGQEPAEKTA
jgi:PAS domain S-box-containing protein